jgi:hypothetical protein
VFLVVKLGEYRRVEEYISSNPFAMRSNWVKSLNGSNQMGQTEKYTTIYSVRSIDSDTRSTRKGSITSSSTSPVEKTFFIEDRTAAILGLFLVQQLGSQFRLRVFT